jgi:hypothetical protein
MPVMPRGVSGCPPRRHTVALAALVLLVGPLDLATGGVRRRRQLQQAGAYDPCYRDAQLGCAEEGKQCGPISDRCGGTIDCGACPNPCTVARPRGGCSACTGWHSPALPTDNLCECVPSTCADEGAACGLVPDRCGGFLDCGRCGGGAACHGSVWAGAHNRSRIVFGGPTQCLLCGDGQEPTATGDNCTACAAGMAGVRGSCSSCPNSSRWREVHVPSTDRTRCECIANTNCSATNCGRTPDGCGGAIVCGGCGGLSGGVLGWACNDTASECYCIPDTCSYIGAGCGVASDSCGGQIFCGNCSQSNAWGRGYACNASNQCECIAEPAELLCARANATCGILPDGCGGQVACRGCASHVVVNVTKRGGAGNGLGVTVNTSMPGGERLCPDAVQTDPCVAAMGPSYEICDQVGVASCVARPSCNRTLSDCHHGMTCLGNTPVGMPFSFAVTTYEQKCQCTDSRYCPCQPMACANETRYRNCGNMSDRCGGMLDCGGCGDDHICRAFQAPFGVVGICECVPRSCQPGQCGEVTDGCGGTIQCGGPTVVGPPGSSFSQCAPLSCPFQIFDYPRDSCTPKYLDDIIQASPALRTDSVNAQSHCVKNGGVWHTGPEEWQRLTSSSSWMVANTQRRRSANNSFLSVLHRSEGAFDYYSSGATSAPRPQLQPMPVCFDIDEAAQMAYANTTDYSISTCSQAVSLFRTKAPTWDVCNRDLRNPCEAMTDILFDCRIASLLGCDFVLLGYTLSRVWCPKFCCEYDGPPTWFADVGSPKCIDKNGYHVAQTMNISWDAGQECFGPPSSTCTPAPARWVFTYRDAVDEDTCEYIHRNNTWQDGVDALCVSPNGTWPFVGTWPAASLHRSRPYPVLAGGLTYNWLPRSEVDVCELMPSGNHFDAGPLNQGAHCTWAPGDALTVRRRSETLRSTGASDIEIGPRMPISIPAAYHGVDWVTVGDSTSSSCRYLHPKDNKAEYYTVRYLGSRGNRPDHTACRAGNSAPLYSIELV